MNRMPWLFLAVACATVQTPAAQIPVRWDAHWISHPDVPGCVYSVQHFRCEVNLKDPPTTWVVHVSADPRCRLIVNGEEVWTGPARSDLQHWPFASLDLADHLKPGINVFGATVWNHGEYNPWSQISSQTAFILMGEGPAAAINTGLKWKVAADPSWSVADTTRYAGIPVGRPVRFDARTHPWGWAEPGFKTDGWATPRIVARGLMRGVPDAHAPWWLVPQSVPDQEHSPQRFSSIARVGGSGPSDGFLAGRSPWVIPPDSEASILLDQRQLTTAYPLIDVEGGRDAEIRMKWAEALVDDKGRKAHRDEVDGRTISTPADVFVLDGSARTLSTHYLRTWRYLQLDFKTAGQPLTVRDVRSIFTAYPFEENAAFSASDASLSDIWRVGWWTQRLCSGDTFYDCPFYEQLQYVGDTRVQALITLYVSGDDRLTRQAIAAFNNSRMPEGLTASRHPSVERQVIPPYSLFWIAMVHDYWMHRRDDAFVRDMLVGVEGVLTWFERRMRPDGLPGPIEWWNFGDWAEGWPRGVPPGAVEGGSAFLALQYVYAARQAADLFGACGEPERAAVWTRRADRTARAMDALCWDTSRGLYADTPEKMSFSQHVNSLAVVSGVAADDKARAIMIKVLDDASLTQCTFYFRFYVNRAMAMTGLGDRYIDQLTPWRDMLDIGLTTFAEKPEPTRSDCHAWSACPNYDFLSLVCGIVPGSPGFASVRIAPSLGPLEWVEGRMPHPRGEIAVRFDRRPDGGLAASVSLPDGVPGAFEWNGQSRPLRPGAQSFTIDGVR